MKVVIAGSRTIKDYDIVAEAVEQSGFDISTVISGCAWGVDKLGEEWAGNNNVSVIQCPADWSNLKHPRCSIRYGRNGKPYNALAGMIRNEEMADKCDAAIIIWDGVSKGSMNMYELAVARGKQVYLETVDVEAYTKEKAERNRLNAIEWAKAMRSDKDALSLDTESSGGSKNDEIISLGVVRLHDGEILLNKFVRPSEDVKFNWYASQVHGITKKELQSAPQLEDIWEEIYSLLHNRTIVAYNYSSDKRMLEQTVRKYGLNIPNINWNCSMAAYKRYTKRLQNTNLSTACAEMNVKAGTHDAVEDALANARIVYRIEQAYNIREV